MFAVLGFMVPPAPVVHAHDDGHDPHRHGTAQAAYAPLHGQEHLNSTADPDDDEDNPHDGDAPEHHVHLNQAPSAIARLRGFDAMSDGSISTAVDLAPVAGFWSLVPHQPQSNHVVPQRGRGGPRVYCRSLDRLLWIGSLLI
jgi:hypothetical protein